jgi:hypothetical protein
VIILEGFAATPALNDLVSSLTFFVKVRSLAKMIKQLGCFLPDSLAIKRFQNRKYRYQISLRSVWLSIRLLPVQY